MKNNRTMLERLFAVVMCLVLLAGLVPAGALPVYAAEEDTSVTALGTVTAVTDGLEVFKPDANNEQLVNNADEQIVLEWCAADETLGRYSDGWWVGVKITAPEGYVFGTENGATLNWYRHEGDTTKGISFDESVDEDDEDAVTLWALITEEFLKDELITYKCELDWDADGAIDQTVNLEIHPENVVLLAEGSAQVEAVTEGLEVVYETDKVTVTNEEVITLEYAEQDLTIGRYTDGWWVGVKVTAPESYVSGAAFDYHRHEGAVSEDLSFDEHVDADADDASMTMFALVTEDMLEAGENIVYTLVLDWDNDGQDDQTVELTLDPSKVILLDENGDRAYPKYATLSSSFGGTVTGENTDNTVLTVSGAQIAFNAEKQGWFVDVTVTEPLNCEEGKEGNNVLGTVTTYYLDLTPAADNGQDKYENIKGEISGDFTWDGTAQKLTLKAENITLLKADQEALKFEGDAPSVQTLYIRDGRDYKLNSYTRIASGGTGDGTITYTSGDENIATVDQNGVVSFKNVGTVTITATKDGGKFYKDATATYTLTIQMGDWGLNFDKPTPDDFVFGTDNNQFTNQAYYQSQGTKNYDGITYAIESSEATGADTTAKVAEVDGEGNLTIYHTGTVTVKATKPADRGHNEATKTYTLTIKAGEQKLSFAEAEQTTIGYSSKETKTYTYTVEGIVGTGALTVTSSNEDVATVEVKDNVITVTPHTSGSFILKAAVAADDNYNAGAVELTVKVLTEQVNMAFENPADQTVTYNDKGNVFKNAVNGAEGSGQLTYTVSDTSIAAVGTDGTVTIYSAGEITVTATKASDDVYAEKTVSYKLTINKDVQDISLETSADTESNDAGSYTIKTVLGTSGEYATGNGIDFTYAVTGREGVNLTTATDVNANGIVTFGDSEYGVVTVTVTRPGNNCYEEWTAIFTLTITEMAINNTNFKILTDINSTTGWYNDDVEIQYVENGNIFNLADYIENPGKKHSHSNWNQTYVLEDGVYEQGDVILCVTKNGGGKGGNKHNIDICANTVLGTIKVDTTIPVDGGVEYTTSVIGSIFEAITLGYYQAQVTATISASDETSGIAAIYYNIDGSEVYQVKTFNGDKNAEVAITLPDSYKGQVKYYIVDMAGNSTAETTDDDVIIVDAGVPEISVGWSEAVRVVDENNNDVEGYDYTSNIRSNKLYYQDTAEATITIKEENFFGGQPGDGNEGVKITINGQTFSHNANSWTQVKDEAGNATDSWTCTVPVSAEGDNVLKVEYTDRSGNKMETYTSETIIIDKTAPQITVKGLDKVNKDDKIIIEIKEKNFRESDVVLTIGATEIQNNQVAAYTTEWKHEGDMHTLTIDLNVDANFTLKVEYTDLAMRSDVEPNENSHNFYVDKVGPTAEISYSESVWGAVTEALSFGYYDADMVVTITAVDAVSGVKEIRYNYDGKWSAATPDANGQISFTINPQYRGQIQYYAVDDADNSGAEITANMTVIVDNVDPTILVEWPNASRVVNADNADDEKYDYTSVSSGHKLYYQESATANITITEENFFNGEAVADSEMLGVLIYDNDTLISADKADWSGAGNSWTNTVTFTEEGKHVLSIEYTDRSKNEMVKYVSNIIVIDKTEPVILLDPHHAERFYTNKVEEAMATLTITETNFRASDVEVTLASVNAAGEMIVSEPEENVSYNAYAKNDANWTHSNDVHTLVLPFNVDANYTLDVAYTDLAQRIAEEEHSEFTLDRVAPTGLSVTFSDNDVTAGYYGAAATATLHASDAVSGIDYYYYVAGGSIEGETDSSFTINPQFNGTVTFVAYDKAGNSTELKDDQNIVVDTIAPTCNVTFSTPYQTVDNVAYYAENILVTVNITEANFFSGDYAVAVTKDGVAHPVNVTWNGSVGTFTLTEDGDYVVNVTGEDHSGNTMTPYTSHILTLDTEAPTIKVTKVVANSANKDEEYTFDIEISDINLDVDTMNPVLTAVIKDDKGSYTTQEIQMNAPAVVEPNRTYRYTVENLTEDALYTLICTASDLSGNEMSQVQLEDEKLYEEVQFSINRSGSAFGYGDDFAEELMNQYYVYSVEQDVILVEVNVDPIENYVVLLNGKELTEGVDYTSTQSSEPGEWSKRQYIINKDLFESEGEYSVIIHSTDKAETPAYSDVKDLSTSFVVDQTAPVITITGLETGGRYLTQEQIVTLIPTDEGGRLNSLKVVVLDSEGQPLTDENGNDISLRFEMSGEELLTYLDEHDGMVTFTVPEGLNNQVQIICNDCAVNSLGQTNEYNELFERVTVSQNQLIIFFANKPLFYGVIAGVLGLIILIILLLKRKKKDEEEGK